MIVIPVAVRFAMRDSCPQIGVFGLSHEKCSDDFSSKSLIALIASIDSAQVGLSRSYEFVAPFRYFGLGNVGQPAIGAEGAFDLLEVYEVPRHRRDAYPRASGVVS